jgi:hypothetical protein
MNWKAHVLFSKVSRDYRLSYSIETSYKLPEREADHWLLSSRYDKDKVVPVL